MEKSPLMKPEPKSTISPEEYETLRGQFPVLDAMEQLKLPMTRESYLAMCYGREVPNPIPAEEQLELPPQFRDGPDEDESPVQDQD